MRLPGFLQPSACSARLKAVRACIVRSQLPLRGSSGIASAHIYVDDAHRDSLLGPPPLLGAADTASGHKILCRTGYVNRCFGLLKRLALGGRVFSAHHQHLLVVEHSFVTQPGFAQRIGRDEQIDLVIEQRANAAELKPLLPSETNDRRMDSVRAIAHRQTDERHAHRPGDDAELVVRARRSTAISVVFSVGVGDPRSSIGFGKNRYTSDSNRRSRAARRLAAA